MTDTDDLLAHLDKYGQHDHLIAEAAEVLRAARDETHNVREGMRRRVIELQKEADQLEAELRAARDENAQLRNQLARKTWGTP